MQEIYDFLKKCGTYYLATVEGNQPRVRPFGTIDLFDGRLTIQTGKVKDVSKQIQQNRFGEGDGNLLLLYRGAPHYYLLIHHSQTGPAP